MEALLPETRDSWILKNYHKSLFGVALLIGVFTSACAKAFFDDFYWRPSLLQHQVVEENNKFQLLWMKSDTFSLANDFDSYIDISEEGVILGGSLVENKAPSLINLDEKTGNIKWEKSIYPTGFAVSKNRIYVGEGIGRISSRSAETGDVLWDAKLEGANNFIYLITYGSSLHALSSTDNFYKLSEYDGELNYTERRTNTFYYDQEASYARSTAPILTARDNSGEIIWQTSLNDSFTQKPIITSDLIILKTQKGADPVGDIYVINRSDGSILWETSSVSVVSNVSMLDNIVFYLTLEGQLTAVDVYSGNVIDEIDFVPEISSEDLVNRRFSIAANNELVVVYLGDSQQLFAFSFLLNSLP